MRIAVLVTCYNRADTSVANLRTLRDAVANAPDVTPEFFVVDDGSSDATGKRVAELGREFTVVKGSGDLYWNGGTRRAYWEALKRGGLHDAYLLFNDDVRVSPEGVASAFSEFKQHNVGAPTAIVGFTVDSDGEISYGGMRIRRLALGGLPYERVLADGVGRLCDTCNGNFVLVPGPQMRAVGGLEPGFSHSYGDMDLGLRLRDHDVRLVMTTRTVGACERGVSLRWRRVNGGIHDRIRSAVAEPDGMQSYTLFVRRHRPAAFTWLYRTQRRARIVIAAFRRA